MKHRCPICKKVVEPISPKRTEDTSFFPFCSQRCKLIDLGAWLDADYKVISKSSEDLVDGSIDDQ